MRKQTGVLLVKRSLGRTVSGEEEALEGAAYMTVQDV